MHSNQMIVWVYRFRLLVLFLFFSLVKPNFFSELFELMMSWKMYWTLVLIWLFTLYSIKNSLVKHRVHWKSEFFSEMKYFVIRNWFRIHGSALLFKVKQATEFYIFIWDGCNDAIITVWNQRDGVKHISAMVFHSPPTHDY